MKDSVYAGVSAGCASQEALALVIQRQTEHWRPHVVLDSLRKGGGAVGAYGLIPAADGVVERARPDAAVPSQRVGADGDGRHGPRATLERRLERQVFLVQVKLPARACRV